MTLATRMNRGPVDPFVSLGLNDFVRSVFGPEQVPSTSYGVDVYEDAEHLYLDAEVPGFGRDQIDVTIDNGVLTIIAERSTPAPTLNTNATDGTPQEAAEAQQPTWHLRERRASQIRRSFQLPKTVDGSVGVDAKLADGVLHLKLAKRPESKPRKITIA